MNPEAMYPKATYPNAVYKDAYLETEVLSAGPTQLIELLYAGALESIAAARTAIGNGDIAFRNQKITKAQSILAELAVCLDHSQGGALSRELAELYDYMQRRLSDANFQQRAEPLEEVAKLLETLQEAWRTVSLLAPLAAGTVNRFVDNSCGDSDSVEAIHARIDHFA